MDTGRECLSLAGDASSAGGNSPLASPTTDAMRIESPCFYLPERGEDRDRIPAKDSESNDGFPRVRVGVKHPDWIAWTGLFRISLDKLEGDCVASSSRRNALGGEQDDQSLLFVVGVTVAKAIFLGRSRQGYRPFDPHEDFAVTSQFGRTTLWFSPSRKRYGRSPSGGNGPSGVLPVSRIYCEHHQGMHHSGRRSQALLRAVRPVRSTRGLRLALVEWILPAGSRLP